MKLALLSGANPQACKECAIIRLPKGRWRFHVHGLVDSELAMNVEGHTISSFDLYDHSEVHFEESTKVQAFFNKRGKEAYITVIAERINAEPTEHP